MTSPEVESDHSPEPEPAPDWEADTAFVEWDQTLPPGTRLRDYEVRRVLAESLFGVVYLAWDHSLQRAVAIREYLPRLLAGRSRGASAIEVQPGAEERYAAGLKAFIAEARLLARFDHPSLIRVYRFWEENASAYVAMPHCEGPTLRRALADGAQPQDEAEVRTWLRPVVDALSVMHAAGCNHLDIGPDSIMLTPGGPVLLGVAAARRLLVEASDGPTASVKSGYAAIEQYGGAAATLPGAWTDFYALAAVVYRAMTGREPVAAPQRVAHDPQPPLASLAQGRGSPGFLEAVDATLALRPEHRPRTDIEFRELIGAMEAPQPTLTTSRQRDLMTEPFEREDDGAREVTVPMPTQPFPAPVAADDPMLRPFVMPTPAVPAVLPFARDEFRLARKTVAAIVVGVAVLGLFGAAALHFHASSERAAVAATLPPAAAPQRTPAAIAPLNAAAPTTATATPTPTPPTPITPTPSTTTTASPVPIAPTTAIVPSAGFIAAPVPPGAASRRIAVDDPPADPAARRMLCGDLLQEATLRRLAADEAAYYKKECR